MGMYVSRMNIRDKVGPLEDNAGNHNIRGTKYALQFRVRKVRYYSLLPIPEIKFNEPEGEMLGQLVVTPEVIATKIRLVTLRIRAGHT